MGRLFKRVTLLCPTTEVTTVTKGEKITQKNVIIEELPPYSSLIEASKYKSVYKLKILSLAPAVDLFYCRVPDPFSWMPAMLTDKPVIMHFVGDTADATKHNISFPWWKKKLLLLGYSFEYKRILEGAKKSTVYTNGSHLSNKLQKYGINATPVVSSTITKNDLAPFPLHSLGNRPFTLIYVGYLRYAKGIDTLIEVIKILEARDFNYQFHIVGAGEMAPALQQLVKETQIGSHIHLYGHVDDRDKLLSLLGSSDLFFFPSLSEGSPRVVIEAMSQGCPVLSTPVGSLPGSFKEEEEILFFPFNDAQVASEKIIVASQDLAFLEKLRNNAYRHVSEDFTMEQFIRTITTPKL